MRRWLVLCLCVCMLTMTACGRANTSFTDASNKLDTTSDNFGEQLVGTEGFSSVAANDSLELLINPSTTEIAVKDIATGYVWYSNPQSEENSYKEIITVTYCDASNNMSGMNSYDDAVAEGQFALQKIDNGVRVVYEIGEKTKTYIIPQVISATDFENDILSKLSEEDAETVSMRYDFYSMDDEMLTKEEKETLKSTYPRFEKEDIYVRAESLPEFALKKLETLISQTGYSIDDLAEDNEYHGLSEPETSDIFVIAVEYCLDDNGLSVNIPTDLIESPNDLTLTNLQLLRYFGAADSTAQGYMLVPDGSGALINLNSDKGSMSPYTAVMYGDNMADDDRTSEVIAHLPIYALKNGDNSYLAIIESGDAAATIQAEVYSSTNKYNHIFSSYEIKRGEKLTTDYSTGLGSDTTDLYVFQKKPLSESISLRFIFQNGEQANYVGMANEYREYLIEKGILTENVQSDDYSMMVDILGAVEYPDSLFGIPVTRNKALTTFSQAEEILTALNDKGVKNADVRLIGWANQGIESKSMKKLRVANALGGKKGINSLISTADSIGYELYPDVDIQFAYSNTLLDGYTTMTDSPKDILGESWLKDKKMITTGETDSSIFVVRPTLYGEYTGSVSKKLTKLGFSGVSTSKLGYTLYADYSNKHTADRSVAADLVTKSLEDFAQSGLKPIVEQGNAYTLKNAVGVVDLPLGSSSDYYIDEDVPFYPIVLHGYLGYSGEALNMASDNTQSYLKALEYGAGLHYTWMYETNDVLRGIDTNYYGVCYSDWLDKAAEQYSGAAKILSAVADSTITAHYELADGVYCTAYSNGIKVFVNYTQQAYAVDGITVSPLGYAMQKGAA